MTLRELVDGWHPASYELPSPASAADGPERPSDSAADDPLRSAPVRNQRVTTAPDGEAWRTAETGNAPITTDAQQRIQVAGNEWQCAVACRNGAKRLGGIDWPCPVAPAGQRAFMRSAQVFLVARRNGGERSWRGTAVLLLPQQASVPSVRPRNCWSCLPQRPRMFPRCGFIVAVRAPAGQGTIGARSQVAACQRPNVTGREARPVVSPAGCVPSVRSALW